MFFRLSCCCVQKIIDSPMTFMNTYFFENRLVSSFSVHDILNLYAHNRQLFLIVWFNCSRFCDTRKTGNSRLAFSYLCSVRMLVVRFSSVSAIVIHLHHIRPTFCWVTSTVRFCCIMFLTTEYVSRFSYLGCNLTYDDDKGVVDSELLAT